MRGAIAQSAIILFGLLVLSSCPALYAAKDCAAEGGNATGSGNTGAVGGTYSWPGGTSSDWKAGEGDNGSHHTDTPLDVESEGTAYRVQVLEDRTSIITVFEGTVRASDPERIRTVLVPAGYKLTVGPDELPGMPVRHDEPMPEKFFYAPGPSPANVSTPNALAAHKGTLFSLLSLHGNALDTEQMDAAVAVGAGFLERGRGLEVTLTMTDVSSAKDFLPSVKWQTQPETPSQPALALGIESVGNMNAAQLRQSPYVVATKTFFRLSDRPLGATTVVSVGWGGSPVLQPSVCECSH